ncbi:hypothetical protein [Streptomyces luteireticuli]|uniref:hypothetical protein n=1 Tax=Streptomyces luteireticuli TaxID=173858 RepID=UPI0035573EAE
MPRRPTFAPDITETVTESIRDHREYLASGARCISHHSTDKEVVGRFSAVAEAVVEAELHIKFGQRYSKTTWSDEDTVQVAALAQCTGHGCTDPYHEVLTTDAFLLDADAAETAQAALPLVATVRSWAQKHAEVCRALPYDGR